MKSSGLFRSFAVSIAASMILASCSKDNDTPPKEEENNEFPKNETWVVYAANSGWSGGIFALKDNKAKELNLAGLPFFQLSSVMGGRTLGKNLYKVNSASNAQGLLKMSLDASGKVVEDKFLPSLSTAYISNYLAVSATEGYYWDDVRGGLKVQKFNPTTMERTGEIDFSSLSEGLPNESAGQLIIAKRDDKLYVDLLLGTKVGTNWQVTPAVKEVAIAVYDLTQNKILNVTKFAGTTNLGVFIDHVLVSLDEKTQDLYFATVADMKTQPTDASSKILRIKKGATTFDADFSIDIKSYQFPAEFNRLFAYDGKIYTTIPSRPTSYYGGGQHGVTYRSDIWFWNEIDATTKKAKRLDMPADAFYGTQNPFLHNGEIYFLSNNTTESYSGVNKYNPATGETKELFHLKESGRLNGFNIIVD
ncbi:MAG: hypothetical protein P0Y53_13775 [Candidatus Pseudobacter hemicellulosilyticus]|uniref:DUF4374 domain-containing protein n=1 Tax=Candidatus Pseudobacter hemicellulosilyticus TaxID=3121375 RepID=A0AAJ5WMU6_9BACT|nr:MAG: hypothetical protein P0Y53_13775 [Pseudobacter sp.]